MSESKKGKALVWINLILFCLFLIQAVSAVLIATGLAGSPVYRLHAIGGFLLIGTVVIHLIFNFGWIKGRFAGKKNRT